MFSQKRDMRYKSNLYFRERYVIYTTNLPPVISLKICIILQILKIQYTQLMFSQKRDTRYKSNLYFRINP